MSAYCQSPRNYYHRFLIAGSFFWSIVFLSAASIMLLCIVKAVLVVSALWLIACGNISFGRWGCIICGPVCVAAINGCGLIVYCFLVPYFSSQVLKRL